MLLQNVLMIVSAVVFSYFLGVNVFDIENNGWAIVTLAVTLSIFIILDTL